MAIFVLLALFVLSNAAVVVGYYNPIFGLDTVMVQMIYEEVPVVGASILLTIIAPINTMIAFFTSRRSYEAYKGELIALAFTTPFLVVFGALPGRSELPDLLHLNSGPMLALIWASQIGACHILRDRAWLYGGRMVGA